MKQPPHVRAWNQAKKHPEYRHRSDHTLEDACDRLVDQWLLSATWQIEAVGRAWEGSLSHINYAGDVFFTLTITDPDDPNRTIAITAPFEQFVQGIDPHTKCDLTGCERHIGEEARVK